MRGQKICPGCNKTVKGVRTHTCPGCGHQFSFGEKKEVVKSVAANGDTPTRGQKVCSNCKRIVGARSSNCKYCGFNFSTQIAKNSKCVIDWHELDKGDYIKVLQGSGPYYFNKLTGEQECVSNSGRYKVVERKKDGLFCWSRTGFEFIYMGPPKKGSTGVINLQPHKILKLRPSAKLMNLLG